MGFSVRKMNGSVGARPNVEIELWLDDKPASASSVQFLYQSEPQPGGHRYRFVITGTRAARELGQLSAGRQELLERRQAERLMAELDWLISRVADVPRRGQYFINTIDELLVDDREVVLSGRCSRINGR